MTKNYKILAKYIKDMSSETPDAETYMYVKDNISRYQLGINIDSKAIKSRLIEIDTSIKFYDKEENVKKSIFEFVYTSVVQVDENLKDKKILEKIVLVDIPKEIYPTLYETFVYLFSQAGVKNISIEKEVDFEKMYNEKFKS